MPHCDGYEGKCLETDRNHLKHTNSATATKRIRKHPNPDIRNILIIAMTASAIQGDREKCLESGMNNYLAKPVRAQTLKALLESYLNKDQEKEIPNLEAEAQKLVKQALNETGSSDKDSGMKKSQDALLDGETGEKKMMRNRPSSVRSVTQRWLGPSGKDGAAPN